MKSLPQSNGVLTATVTAQARLVRIGGTAPLASFGVALYSPGTVDPLFISPLHDDGASGDSLSGDGIYSALIQFTIPRSASGVFLLRFVATDQIHFQSNTLEAPLVMLRDNQPPVLSNLVAPDTEVVPAGGSVSFQMSIRATDQDGQADITQVYFLSLDSSDPTQHYVLKNDGSAPGSVAGDSTYAIIIQAQDSPTIRKTYRFAFHAVDTFGDTSGTILHSITLH